MSSLRPSCKHRVASAEGLYVFDVAINSEARVASTASDHSLHVLQLDDLREEAALRPHSKTITCIEFSQSNPHIIFSSSTDKSAAMWDLRAKTPSLRFTFGEEALSVSCSLNDSLLAVAVGSRVSFRDIRNGSQSSLGEYADVHTDIVTAVKFSLDSPTLLVSGGEDGLVNVYDTAAVSGEAAVQSIMNVDCPPRRIGFFQREGLYCLTSTEIASFWHYPSAQRIGNFTSIREDRAVDYLTDCFVEPAEERLFLLAGKFSGAGSLLQTEPSMMSLSATLELGHEDIIRSCAYHSSSRTLVTGGEDGNICAWNMSSLTADESEDMADSKTKRRKT